MSASFIASGGLAVVGGASLAVAPKEQRVLALVPLLFSVQQALEGIQWSALGHGYICRPAGYGFLFFALLLWPVYIPLVVYLLDRSRRKVIGWFVAIGTLVAVWYGYLLIMTPLAVQTVSNHIFYNPPGPFDFNPIQLLYITTVAGAMLFSSRSYFRQMGFIALGSALAAVLISRMAAASVWCFFAAGISLCVYVALRYRWLT